MKATRDKAAAKYAEIVKKHNGDCWAAYLEVSGQSKEEGPMTNKHTCYFKYAEVLEGFKLVKDYSSAADFCQLYALEIVQALKKAEAGEKLYEALKRIEVMCEDLIVEWEDVK